jgi:hypothetical protein
MNQIGKTNVTLWKNRDTQKRHILPSKSTKNKNLEESSKIENDFIDNLKSKYTLWKWN